jgi:MFS family permease
VRKGHVLVAAALGAALNPLNSTMIAVALPAISRDFSADASTVTLLVVTGYLIATLICQMPAGSVADRLGYARALTWGRGIFAVGAIVGAFAPTLAFVVVGRVLMAAGGALMVPTSMALLRTATAPDRRARAFGTLGAVMAGAAAIGPAVGGLVAALLGWRWLFAINIPVIFASWLVQGRSQDERTPAAGAPHPMARPFDWAGSALSALSLLLLTLATRTSGVFAGALASSGVVTFIALMAIERRASAPVLDLDLFARPAFVAAAGVIATQNLAMYSLLILVPFLFGLSGGANAGLAIVAMTATMAVTAPLGGRLAERLGNRTMVCIGGVISALAVAAIGRIGIGGTPFDTALRLLPVGLGIGLSTGPAQAAGLSAIPAGKSALGSATLSMMRYVGSIAGTVILGWVLASESSRQQLALYLFAGAFVLSALLALGLKSSGEVDTVAAEKGVVL